MEAKKNKMDAKKNKEDQQAIQKLMEMLEESVHVLECEFGWPGDPPVVKFVKNEGKIWTLKFDGKSFRLNIEVE